jgi:hypothetical protein
VSIHQTLEKLSEEVLDEYLAIAKICVTERKPDGGIYGYPAVLLLFCIVDALSTHLGKKEHSFHAFNDPCFGLALSEPQLKNLRVWYRHCLAHNGVIASGTMLTPEPGDFPFEFSSNGELTVIHVLPFYQRVEQAWKAFDRTKLHPKTLDKRSLPQAPALTATTSAPLAASGAYIPPVK